MVGGLRSIREVCARDGDVAVYQLVFMIQKSAMMYDVPILAMHLGRHVCGR